VARVHFLFLFLSRDFHIYFASLDDGPAMNKSILDHTRSLREIQKIKNKGEVEEGGRPEGNGGTEK
jgi:hypothetical protein